MAHLTGNTQWLAGLTRKEVLAFAADVVQRMIAKEYLPKKFESAPLAVGAAPGRVEIGGHHTDYCGGVVLGFAIGLGTVCIILPSKTWRIVSVDAYGNPLMGKNSIFKSRERPDINQWKKGHWLRYVFGSIRAYEEATRQTEGGPYTMLLVNNLPLGAGLSSSASLELSIASALEGLHRRNLSKIELALLAKKAENEYAGLGCGLLDQGVSAFGKNGKVVQIDTITNQVSRLPHNLTGMRWVVVHSGVTHQLTRTNYGEVATLCRNLNDRICETGSPLSRKGFSFCAKLSKLRQSGEISAQEFLCASHVVNSGVLAKEMARALRADDPVSVGKCLNDAHRSLSALHGISCEQVDILQALLAAQPGVLGVSIMGGGGGGAVCCLVFEDEVAGIKNLVSTAFDKPLLTLEVAPSAGAWGKQL